MPKNVWHRLQSACKPLRRLRYDKQDYAAAKLWLPALKLLLEKLPADDGAIIGAEAYAIYHELRGERELAIGYRKRQVALTHQLYDEIRRHNCDENMRKWLLQNYEEKVLARTNEIIKYLENKSGNSEEDTAF